MNRPTTLKERCPEDTCRCTDLGFCNDLCNYNKWCSRKTDLENADKKTPGKETR